MPLTAGAVAKQTYYILCALCGASLIYFFPPHFDLTTTTLISVAIVALFLALVEHPAMAAGISAAPLTAVIGASTVLFGWWALVLVAVAWGAAHLRIKNRATPLRVFRAWACQVGFSFIAIYSMMAIWNRVTQFNSHVGNPLAPIVTLVAVVGLGMLFQTFNNIFAYFSHLVAGSRIDPLRLAPVGLLAAVYGYILVAIYHFGGIIGTALFYVFVGQERMVQSVLGLTNQLQQLYHARAQARVLVSDLMRFTDIEQGRFAEEVQMLAQRMANQFGLSKEQVATIGLAAELHEIGKARLPAKVRGTTKASGNGNGDDHGTENGHVALTPQEVAQLKTYPRAGALMVREADALLPTEIAYWIECHDEHFDGSGFPRGLKGEEIPLPSRIIALAREFVRLTIGSNGDYENQKEAALANIRERSGTLFDPKLVSLLEELLLTVSPEYNRAYAR